MINSFTERENTVKELNLISNLLDYAEYRSNLSDKLIKKLYEYKNKLYNLIETFDNKNLDKPKNYFKSKLK